MFVVFDTNFLIFSGEKSVCVEGGGVFDDIIFHSIAEM
jgi:hypothetical protein